MPEVKVPELAESITEGTIAEWLKQVGDSVDKGEAILELETDKVNVEVVSEEAGVLQELLANEGDTVEVGQSIAVVGEGSGNNNSEAPKQDNSESQAADSNEKSEQPKSEAQNDNESTADDSQNKGQRVNATPSARKYAREKGIDLSEVATQSKDVVRKEHVDQSQNNKNEQAAQSSSKEEPKNKQLHKTQQNQLSEKKCLAVRKQLPKSY